MKKTLVFPILIAMLSLTGCGTAAAQPATNETITTTPAAIPDETIPSELDVFTDAVLNPNMYDNAYPASLTVTMTSGDPAIGIDCLISKATPECITIDAAANAEKAEKYLSKNNFTLSADSRQYTIIPTEIKHYLLSDKDLTEPVLETLQDGMTAEFSAASLTPEAMYTVLPSPDTDYLTSNTSNLDNSLRPESLAYKQHRLYIIFSDESGTYHVGYANPVFQTDGTLIHVNEQSLDYTRYGHLESETGRPDFEDLDTAYRAIETAHQPFADTLILSKYTRE